MPRRLAVAAFFLVAGQSALAASPVVGTSMQSFSGVIETPHAETLGVGRAALSFTDHSPLPGLSDGNPRSITLNFGLFEGLELGGRLTEVDGEDAARDLLGHAKLRLFSRPGWPSLAVGVQDFQGNRRFGGSAYTVASWSPVEWLRISGGYGFREARLHEGFGSIELSPFRYLTLLGEYSDEVGRAGAGVEIPLSRGISAHLKGAYDFDREDTTVLAELQLPLGRPQRSDDRALEVSDRVAVAVTELGAEALYDGLRAAGYQSVRAAVDAQEAMLCVDPGQRFRAAADAIGVAFGLMDSRLPASVSRFSVILQREGAAQLKVEMSREDFRAFVSATGASSLTTATSQWAPANACGELPEVSTPRTRYEAILSPNLVTFYGTEFGVLDYDLSLRLRLQANLGRSGTFFVSLLSPAARSEDFEPGAVFSGQRSRSGVDQALYQLYARPAANWSTLTSIGFMRVFHNDSAAVLQEQIISSATGRHALRLNVGAFVGQEKQLGVAVADYIWLWPEQDLRFSVGGGRFAAGDTGARAELARYFGDTLVSLFVRGRDREEAVGGISISVPLLPRFSGASTSDFALRGAERWRHGAGSSFSDENGRNPLRPRLLVEPLPDRNLRDTYLDSNRLAPDWVLEQSWRLREAYLQYLYQD